MTYEDDKHDPFNQSMTTEEADAAIFGAVDVPESGRVIAQPIDIFAIWPDLKQPRRVIPAAARDQWNGYPSDLTAVLGDWHALAESRLGPDGYIDINKTLMSYGEGAEEAPTGDPLVDAYLDLLSLAASILHDGLTNPITVVSVGRKHIIETGERRWLAHHLLCRYDQAKFHRIAARVMDKSSVWRQATENSRRADLNAIGVSRQLALLIMDMYAGDDGVKFDPYDNLVLPGEPDRCYYAQVANGNIYRVKRGMGQRLLDVVSLKSMSQVRQYRALLSLPDDLWVQADEESWSEFRIREHIKPDPPHPKMSENDQKPAYTVTGVTVSPPKQADSGDSRRFVPFDPNETPLPDPGDFDPTNDFPNDDVGAGYIPPDASPQRFGGIEGGGDFDLRVLVNTARNKDRAVNAILLALWQVATHPDSVGIHSNDDDLAHAAEDIKSLYNAIRNPPSGWIDDPHSYTAHLENWFSSADMFLESCMSSLWLCINDIISAIEED